MAVRIALIAAVARNGVIGDDSVLPWRLSTDLARFKRLTLGKPVVMGRRTFAAIGKPLPGRTNIVVTRDPAFAAAGATVAGSLEAALSAATSAAAGAGVDEIMVIGGGQIYAEAIGRADRLYVTHVEAAPDGDAHFPAIDPAVWRVVSGETVPAGPRDAYASAYMVYDRIAAPAAR